MDRELVEKKFNAALETQTEYWVALHALEEAIGCEIDEMDITSDDLASMDLDALIELATATLKMQCRNEDRGYTAISGEFNVEDQSDGDIPLCGECRLPLAEYAGPSKGERGMVCQTPGCSVMDLEAAQ